MTAPPPAEPYRPGSIVRHCAPLAGFLLVYTAFRVFYNVARVDHVELALESLTWTGAGELGRGIDRLLAVVAWSLSGMLFALAWLVGVAGMLYVTSRALRRARWVCWLGSAGVLALGIWLAAFGENPLTLPVLLPVLEKTFTLIGLDRGESLLYLVYGLALLAALLVMLATTATLAGSEKEADDARRLRERLRSQRLVLYLGAAILVSGSLQAVAVHHLPLPLLEPEAAAILDRAGKSISAAMGLLWTLLLFGIYTPAALILENDTRRLAGAAAGDEPATSRAEWLAKQGLDVSLRQQLTGLLAMLAPLLAGGPGATLLEVLIGH